MVVRFVSRAAGAGIFATAPPDFERFRRAERRVTRARATLMDPLHDRRSKSSVDPGRGHVETRGPKSIRGTRKVQPEMSRPRGAVPTRRPKVLVVDDNEVCRAVVRETLEEDGFDVIELGSPVGMSSVVNHEKPDVVLMDVEMPAIEGDKAVEILLKHRLHDCKILLYSGRSAAELEKLARSCGASGFVPKTVTDAALATAIRAHLT